MRQKTRIIALLLVVCLLTACSIPFAYPDGGEFYCEELQMTLDFLTYKATFVEAGTEITKTFHLDYGSQLSIENFDEDWNYDPVLVGDFRYRSGKVTVKTDDGHKYTFLPVEK